jgi:ABC-type lipoprotein release transport system permease subunit
MYEYDMKHAYIDLAVAQRFLRAEGQISGIEIRSDVEKPHACCHASLDHRQGDSECAIGR